MSSKFKKWCSIHLRIVPARAVNYGFHVYCREYRIAPATSGTLPTLGTESGVELDTSRKTALVAFYYRQLLISSPDARTSALTSFDSSLSCARWPPVQALRATSALPSGLFGPDDCCHGFHRLMASLCCLRRSGVQPLFFGISFLCGRTLYFLRTFTEGIIKPRKGLKERVKWILLAIILYPYAVA